MLLFYDNATAGGARVISNWEVAFSGNATAGDATIENSGLVRFSANSTAGNAALNNIGSGIISLEGSTGPGGLNHISAGSIAGGGRLWLGANEFTVGGNNISTTFSGIIEDHLIPGGSLVKIGTGTLTLSGANTYTGGTTIAGGAISIGADNNLGNPAAGLTFDGGTLITTASFTSSHGVTLNAGGGTIDTGANTLELSGDITGAGGLTKIGLGTLRLSGVFNDYTGPTNILAGELSADDGALSIDSDVTVASGARLTVAGTNAIGSLSGAGIVDIAVDEGLYTGFNGVSATFSGTFSGGGSLSIEGGTQILTGSGSAIGMLEICGCSNTSLILRGGDLSVADVIQVSGGVFRVEQGAKLTALPTSPFIMVDAEFSVDGSASRVEVGNMLVFSSATTTLTVSGGGTLVSGGASLDATDIFGPASLDVTITGASSSWTINSGGGVSVGLDGAFGGPFSAPQPVTVSVADGGKLVADQIAIAGNGTLKLGLGGLPGTIAAPFITNEGRIVADFVGEATLDAAIDGSGTLTKQGSGTLVLSGANSYTGTTFLNGGALSIASDANLGDPGSTLVFNGGTLQVTGTGLTALARPIVFDTAGGGFDIADAANIFTIAQSLGGPGSLTKSGAGALVLTASNTYGGGTVVKGGALSVARDGNLGDPAGTLALDGGVLRITGTGFSQTSRVITLGAGGGGFDIADAANTFTLGQSLSGTGGLSKAGAGTLVLTGANSYSGGTTINGGTLVGNSASLQGQILNNAALVFKQSVAGTFAGTISGTGSFAKLGTGMLTLTGANTYSGGTTISGGTLVGDSTSLQGPILNNAALVFDQAAGGSFAGAISGTGTLAKQGAGTLILTGTSTLSGPTTVTAGQLTVNGSLAGSVVTLNGGTLGGSGTLGGIVVNGGTVAPGNSIGTLNIAGNVGFGAGATYQVELDATGASDSIVATGTATLNGGQVQVLAANGAYAQSTRYSILTAQGGVSGQFAGATSDLAFLTPSLSYGGNEVVLTMARNQVAFPAVAITRNQAGASHAAEALGTGNAIYDRLLGTTAEQARAGFDALSGEAHAQAVSIAVEDSHLIRESILNRLRAPFGPAAAGGSVEGSFTADLPGRKSSTAMPAPVFDPSRFAIWGEAIGAKGSTDRDGNAGSLHRSGGGMLLGMEMKSDTLSAAQWRLGVAGGYTQRDFDIDARAARGELSSVHGAIYGGTRFGAVSFRAGAAYAWSETDMRRQVSLPGFTDNLRLDGRSATAQAFAEIGYGLTLGPVAFEPFAQIAAVSIRTDRAAEQGGAAALVVLGRDQRLGFTTLGLRAEAQLGALPLIARGMLGWRHAFGDTTPAADLTFVTGVTPFRSYAAPLARDTLLAEAGLAWKASRSTTLGLSYGAALSDNARDHALKGRIDIMF
ncbi:hypothetical protein ASE63_23745 [Bosea sp. Root381]|uniref:autotransporter domain-containing protein n=1 Tax=Bosea sp. Root381 TaxID=1736524 RepID=UPI0006F99023|nr:autotransporter domain-containing protein [Bosea sp. Root381]KRE06723.1 hypothetical protein ASE63_23745 [Bosea sp. Root381]